MFECVVGVFITLLLEYVISNFNFLIGCWFCYSRCWSGSGQDLCIVLLLCVCVWCGPNCCYLEFVIVNIVVGVRGMIVGSDVVDDSVELPCVSVDSMLWCVC